MDLNAIGLWIATLGGVSLLVQAARLRTAPRSGWVAVAVGLLALTAVVFAVAPDVAGLVAGGGWLVFVLAPSLGSRWGARLAQREQYGRARVVLRGVALLHPADGMREQPRLVHALELAQRGDLAAAREVLEAIDARSPVGRLARAQLLRITADWAGICAWVEGPLGGAGLVAEPGLIPAYLRALAETRGPEALVAAFARLEKVLTPRPLAPIADASRLVLFTFTGRRDALDALLRGGMAQIAPRQKAVWRATSDFVRGAPDARAALERLRGEADPTTAVAISRRLAGEDPPPVRLSPKAAAIVEHEARAAAEEAHWGETSERSKPRATIALIGTLVAVFVVELALGGSTDIDALLSMGALATDAPLDRGGFSLIAFTLLHYGELHLVMNVSGLWFIGPFVEHALGVRRYLALYLLSGVGGGLVAVAAYQAGLAPAGLLVGASGSIMGLVGASAALFFRGWRGGVRVARRRLVATLTVVAVQVAFDIATPQVSFTAHAVGVVVGAAIALGMRSRLRETADAAGTVTGG